MQWQMIGNLADDHLCQQRCTGRTLGDRLRRLGGRLHRALAGVLLADVFDHKKLRGDVFIALADFLTEQAQVLLATRTMLLFSGKIVLDAFAFQMRCQRPASAAAILLRLAGAGSGRGRLAVFGIALRAFKFFGEELQLIRTQLLALG